LWQQQQRCKEIDCGNINGDGNKNDCGNTGSFDQQFASTAYCELLLPPQLPTEVQTKAIAATTTTALQMAEPTNESLIVAVI